MSGGSEYSLDENGMFGFSRLLTWYSPGQDIVRSVAGPMSCSLATIERYMEALPCAAPWELDQHTVPVPWRRSMASLKAKRLRIGFLIDDGVVKVQPPIARAVREVVDALKAAGHEGIFTHSYSFMYFLTTMQSSNGMRRHTGTRMNSGKRPFCPMAGRAVVGRLR